MSNDIPRIFQLNEEKKTILKKIYNYDTPTCSHIFVGEKKYLYPSNYETKGTNIYNVECRKDDVWISTFPRSGSTWSKEMIWLILNDLDFATARAIPTISRVCLIDLPIFVGDTVENLKKNHSDKEDAQLYIQHIDSVFDKIKNTPSPRFIKTHFPLSLVPNIMRAGAKVIYVARNPKDLCVSFYHFHRNFKLYNCENLDFATFWRAFRDGLVENAPYWEHVKEAWKLRHNPNVLFIFYEEMVQDLPSVVRKVASFVDKTYTNEQFQQLVDHLQFSNVKNNNMMDFTTTDAVPAARAIYVKAKEHIRKGKKQAWHELFTSELNEEANQWIRENLKDSDLKFPHIDIYA